MYELLDKYTKLRPTETDPIFDASDYVHYVYIIINIETKQFYIGKHSEQKDKGYYGTGTYIKNAVKFYGKEKFIKYIISYHKTSQEAFDEERKIITPDMIMSNDCYNFMLGGNGYQDNENHPNFNKELKLNHPWKKYTTNPGVLLSLSGNHPWQKQNRSHNPKKSGKEKRSKVKFINKDSHLHKLALQNKHNLQVRSSKGLNPSTLASENGTMYNKNIKPWKNAKSNTNSKLMWWLADQIYLIHKTNPEFRTDALRNNTNKVLEVEKFYNIKLRVDPFKQLLKYFETNKWVPNEDEEWINFKKQYNPLEIDYVIK